VVSEPENEDAAQWLGGLVVARDEVPRAPLVVGRPVPQWSTIPPDVLNSGEIGLESLETVLVTVEAGLAVFETRARFEAGGGEGEAVCRSHHRVRDGRRVAVACTSDLRVPGDDGRTIVSRLRSSELRYPADGAKPAVPTLEAEPATDQAAAIRSLCNQPSPLTEEQRFFLLSAEAGPLDICPGWLHPTVSVGTELVVNDQSLGPPPKSRSSLAVHAALRERLRLYRHRSHELAREAYVPTVRLEVASQTPTTVAASLLETARQVGTAAVELVVDGSLVATLPLALPAPPQANGRRPAPGPVLFFEPHPSGDHLALLAANGTARRRTAAAAGTRFDSWLDLHCSRPCPERLVVRVRPRSVGETVASLRPWLAWSKSTGRALPMSFRLDCREVPTSHAEELLRGPQSSYRPASPCFPSP